MWQAPCADAPAGWIVSRSRRPHKHAIDGSALAVDVDVPVDDRAQMRAVGRIRLRPLYSRLARRLPDLGRSGCHGTALLE